MNYGIILKNLREENNLKQTEIAKYLGIDNSQYCHYENESRTLPIKHLNSLSQYYNVSIDFLFNFTDIKTYQNDKKDIDNKLSGRRIKEFRKENKLTQKALAAILNTTFSTISFYEKGDYTIATPYIYTICKKYNISADYLLGKTDEPKYLTPTKK